MAQNQNQTNPGQGGQNRNRQQNGNGNQPQSKMVIKAYATVNVSTSNTFILFVEASAFLFGKPLSGQEVTLREGIKTLDAQTLDINGEIMLRATGSLTDHEETKTIRVCLTGLPEEKNLSVTIPAIKRIVNRKKNIMVSTTSTIDSSANTAEIVFSCLVSEDNNICSNQRIALLKGAAQLEEKLTDANGRVTFIVSEPVLKTDTTILYRVVLPGLTDEVEANVVLPAQVPNTDDNDPEDLILNRYHDGRGNFTVAIRVLKANGVGLPLTGKILYRGTYYCFTTDNQGECLFSVPGLVRRGNDFPLKVTVSGIANEAVIRIKRTAQKANFRKKKWWLITTNNGRGFLMLGLMVILWLGVIIWTLNNSPIISADLFRNSETGLSPAEELYNVSALAVDANLAIKPVEVHRLISSGYIFWLIVYSSFAIFYSIFSWREEIINGIEDGIEKILDKDHGRADDPRLERWMKHFGMSHKVKRSPINVVSSTSVPAQTQIQAKTDDEGGHPSIATLFKLDLLSDVLVTLVPAIFRKVFGK